MDELDKLLSHSFEDIVNDRVLLRELFRLAENLLHLPYKTCPGTHRKYYEKLKTIKNKPMKQKSYLDKKYILKPGKVLYYNHQHYNNDTLTDKMAANAIKKFPALVGAFLSEKERAILEAKAAAKHNVAEAENNLADEQFENQIIALLDAEKFDEARELAGKLLVEETREAALEAIDAGEEKLKEAARVAEEKLADEKAKTEQEARDKKAEAKKVEAEKKKRTAAEKKKEAEKNQGNPIT